MNKTTLEGLEKALERLEHIDGVYSWGDLLCEVREALAETVKQEPVAEAHSGNLRWLIPDEEQPANAKLFLHPSESRFNATYENG